MTATQVRVEQLEQALEQVLNLFEYDADGYRFDESINPQEFSEIYENAYMVLEGSPAEEDAFEFENEDELNDLCVPGD